MPPKNTKKKPSGGKPGAKGKGSARKTVATHNEDASDTQPPAQPEDASILSNTTSAAVKPAEDTGDGGDWTARYSNIEELALRFSRMRNYFKNSPDKIKPYLHPGDPLYNETDPDNITRAIDRAMRRLELFRPTEHILALEFVKDRVTADELKDAKVAVQNAKNQNPPPNTAAIASLEQAVTSIQNKTPSFRETTNFVSTLPYKHISTDEKVEVTSSKGSNAELVDKFSVSYLGPRNLLAPLRALLGFESTSDMWLWLLVNGKQSTTWRCEPRRVLNAGHTHPGLHLHTKLRVEIRC
jgi:hypothetical protein